VIRVKESPEWPDHCVYHNLTGEVCTVTSWKERQQCELNTNNYNESSVTSKVVSKFLETTHPYLRVKVTKHVTGYDPENEVDDDSHWWKPVVRHKREPIMSLLTLVVEAITLNVEVCKRYVSKSEVDTCRDQKSFPKLKFTIWILDSIIKSLYFMHFTGT